MHLMILRIAYLSSYGKKNHRHNRRKIQALDSLAALHDVRSVFYFTGRTHPKRWDWDQGLRQLLQAIMRRYNTGAGLSLKA